MIGPGSDTNVQNEVAHGWSSGSFETSVDVFVKVFHNWNGGFGCWLDRFISVTGLDKLWGHLARQICQFFPVSQRFHNTFATKSTVFQRFTTQQPQFPSHCCGLWNNLPPSFVQDDCKQCTCELSSLWLTLAYSCPLLLSDSLWPYLWLTLSLSLSLITAHSGPLWLSLCLFLALIGSQSAYSAS